MGAAAEGDRHWRCSAVWSSLLSRGFNITSDRLLDIKIVFGSRRKELRRFAELTKVYQVDQVGRAVSLELITIS